MARYVAMNRSDCEICMSGYADEKLAIAIMPVLKGIQDLPDLLNQPVS